METTVGKLRAVLSGLSDDTLVIIDGINEDQLYSTGRAKVSLQTRDRLHIEPIILAKLLSTRVVSRIKESDKIITYEKITRLDDDGNKTDETYGVIPEDPFVYTIQTPYVAILIRTS